MVYERKKRRGRREGKRKRVVEGIREVRQRKEADNIQILRL